MCCETKRKIADSLVFVLNEKPLKKVTVKDIMSCENMNRQTFYYHFQDIYGVVEWMFREDFATKLAYDEKETIEEWVMRAIEVVQENKAFYRRVLESVERERVIKDMSPVIVAQIEQRLQGYEIDSNLQQFVVRSLCHYILDGIESREAMSKEKIMTAVYGIKRLLISCQGNLYTF